MLKNFQKKNQLIDKLADFILDNGLHNTGLRTLAKYADTSDRMLLHYFKDKDDLLKEVLSKISDNFISILTSINLEILPFEQLIKRLSSQLNDSSIKPYARIWLQLAAFSAHDEQPYLDISNKIMNDYFSWIKSKVKADSELEKETYSSFLIVITEGFTFLNSIKRDDLIIKSLDIIDSKTHSDL